MEYTISQAAEHFGITAHTLRFYDKEGLLPFVDRGVGGKRIFKDRDLGWLQIIECLKDTGMPIKEIRAYLELCMKGDKTLQRRLEIMREHKKFMQEKLELIRRHMKKIDYKLWYYETAIAAGTESIHKCKDNSGKDPEASAKSDLEKKQRAAKRKRKAEDSE